MTSTVRLSISGIFALTFILVVGSSVLRADVVQSNTALPPSGGQYTAAPVCVATGCTQNSRLDNFVLSSVTESGSDELAVVNARYSSDVYTNNGGSPGTFLGSVSINGVIDMTYFNRDPVSSPLGTFNTQFTGFDFLGKLNGNSFEVTENPGLASAGTTSIDELSTSPLLYTVSSTLVINAEISINGSPFLPAPSQTTSLTPSIPEPGYAPLVALVLLPLGLLGRRLRAQ